MRVLSFSVSHVFHVLRFLGFLNPTTLMADSAMYATQAQDQDQHSAKRMKTAAAPYFSAPQTYQEQNSDPQYGHTFIQQMANQGMNIFPSSFNASNTDLQSQSNPHAAYMPQSGQFLTYPSAMATFTQPGSYYPPPLSNNMAYSVNVPPDYSATPGQGVRPPVYGGLSQYQTSSYGNLDSNMKPAVVPLTGPYSRTGR
jgi:hypothetical protein